MDKYTYPKIDIKVLDVSASYLQITSGSIGNEPGGNASDFDVVEG